MAGHAESVGFRAVPFSTGTLIVPLIHFSLTSQEICLPASIKEIGSKVLSFCERSRIGGGIHTHYPYIQRKSFCSAVREQSTTR